MMNRLTVVLFTCATLLAQLKCTCIAAKTRERGQLRPAKRPARRPTKRPTKRPTPPNRTNELFIRPAKTQAPEDIRSVCDSGSSTRQLALPSSPLFKPPLPALNDFTSSFTIAYTGPTGTFQGDEISTVQSTLLNTYNEVVACEQGVKLYSLIISSQEYFPPGTRRAQGRGRGLRSYSLVNTYAVSGKCKFCSNGKKLFNDAVRRRLQSQLDIFVSVVVVNLNEAGIEEVESIAVANGETLPITESPSAQPTIAPTRTPTLKPTFLPTPVPTPNPTPGPTPNPTPQPTAQPTPVPTPNPTAQPTPAPTPQPTAQPTPVPTPQPTLVPTIEPTPNPTFEPTIEPTPNPTLVPTLAPSQSPTTTPLPCDDSEDAEFPILVYDALGNTNVETQNCIWLAARKPQQSIYCKPEHPLGIYDLCAETCQKCSDTCVDDPVATFLYAGISRDCDWLSTRPSVQIEECVPGKLANAQCSETCDSCSRPGPGAGGALPIEPHVICDDNDEVKFYVDQENGNQTCYWLRDKNRQPYRNDLCRVDHPSRAYDLCEETCEKCTDNCVDSSRKFTHGNGVQHDCLWLRIRPALIHTLCVVGELAYTACPETCGVCD